MTIIEKIKKVHPDTLPAIFLVNPIDWQTNWGDVVDKNGVVGRWRKIGIHYLTYADFVPPGQVCTTQLCTDVLRSIG